MIQDWLLVVFQGITAAGVLYGIWSSMQTRREAVAAAREAASHARDAVSEIQHVAAKVEEVHQATNGMKNQLIEATGISREMAGEKRGIAIGRAESTKTT